MSIVDYWSLPELNPGDHDEYEFKKKPAHYSYNPPSKEEILNEISKLEKRIEELRQKLGE